MAKIREEDLELLRERADIVDVVSSHTHLKKSGGHTFKGLCPFHSEKTPSFTVDSTKGLYFCFGCGEGGDVFKFVEKQENLPFNDAAEWLARRFGVELRYEDARPGDASMRGLKGRLIEANEAAADFFHRALMASPEARDARLYLEGRGLGRDVAERWKFGWAPGRDSLVKHLLGKKFSRDEILKADLGRVSERDGALYDTFRQRITFPTWNLQGDVVAFGARALGDQQPKYLNSAETPVFSKSRVMFGLNRAKSAIARGAALVVEGYTDVILLHEAGISEAVATNGVALGETHFELLKKFSGRAVLMFDADEAGKGAAERGWGPDVKQAPLFSRLGLEVLVAPLPPGRDPADLVREEGAEGIRKVVDAAQPLIEFKLEQTIAKLPLDTPEARARAVREAARVLGWHPDPISRREYEFAVARRVGVEIDAVQRALAEHGRGSSERDEIGGTRAPERRVPGNIKVEKEALRLLLAEGGRAVTWAREVGEPEFTAPARRELFVHALAAAETGTPVAELANNLSPDALTLMTEVTVGSSEEAVEEGEIREVFMRLKVFKLEREIKARRNTLQEVNPLVDAQRHDALFTELVGLEAERRDLLRTLQGAA